MNQINIRVETTKEIVIVEEADENGDIIAVETLQTVKTLYINVTHKTSDTIA